MRLLYLVGVAIIFVSSGILNAQQEHNSLVDNTKSSNNLLVDQLNFADNYKIDFKKCVFRELKTGSYLDLSQNHSTSSNIKIAKGEILETYTYYKNNSLYIIYYDKTWGFIPVEAFEQNTINSGEKTSNDFYKPPKLLSRNPEKYLRFAFPNNSNGEVLLNMLISNTGAVKDITVLKSIPEIDESVIDSLKKLRFKPARRNGCPVEAQYKLPIKYSSGN